MSLRASLFPLLLSAALPFQTATPPAATAPSTTTFHSDTLHLDYTYNSAMIAMPVDEMAAAVQTEKDKTSGALKATISCITVPLTAVDQEGGIRMVVMIRTDATCLGQSITSGQLPSIATSALTQSLARFGTPQVGTADAYKVGGHDAAALAGSVKSEKYGITFYGVATCTIQGTDGVCWEMISNECSRLPAMMKSPVKFEGQPPDALIPEKFAPACS